MNERIKEVRKSLGMSQEKFGEKLGVTKGAISRMELGTYSITDTMFKLICSEYNVNEEWLRTGEGTMFKEEDFFFDLGYYSQKATDLDKAIIIEWMKLPEKKKASIYDFWKKVIQKTGE